MNSGWPKYMNILCVLSCFSHVRLCVTLWIQRSLPAPLSMGFSRQKTRVGCHFLLQGIFLTQGSNSHLLSLLYWQKGSLPLVPPNVMNHIFLIVLMPNNFLLDTRFCQFYLVECCVFVYSCKYS